MPSLTVTMFNYAISPYDDWQQLGWAAAFHPLDVYFSSQYHRTTYITDVTQQIRRAPFTEGFLSAIFSDVSDFITLGKRKQPWQVLSISKKRAHSKSVIWTSPTKGQTAPSLKKVTMPIAKNAVTASNRPLRMR
jgi:hypothetical protein